jgi:hypothetical protein
MDHTEHGPRGLCLARVVSVIVRLIGLHRKRFPRPV